jgi:hypothetical protein
MRELYGTICRAAEGLEAAGNGKSTPAMLTAVRQQCGMAENKQGSEPS